MKRMLVLLLALALCVPAFAQDGPGTLRIKLFKSGKADAFLLRFGEHAVLIDTAETDDAEDILEYMAEKEVLKLDLLILTHFDKGHAGGAPEILNTVPVDKVLMPSYSKDSAAKRALDDALAGVSAQTQYLDEDLSFQMGGVQFDVNTARETYYAEDEDNDFSLVTSVRHGQNRFLFTGDILSQRIEEMMASGADWRSTLLQVPDHGRNGSATEAFLRAAAPAYAVITCSEKNPPAGAVLALLQQMGVQTYLTKDGDIALTSDGQAITFKQ